MAASWPTNYVEFKKRRQYVDVFYAQHINEVQSEISAVEDNLGVPGGGNFSILDYYTGTPVYPDVRTRIEAIEFSTSALSHTHIFADPTPVTPGVTNNQGVLPSFSRSDHAHRTPAFGTPAASHTSDAQAQGSTGLFAQSDHVHPRSPGLDVIPAGLIWEMPGNVIPDGWMECAGQLVNRADYPNTFQAIGTYWNTGGETILQFRLPDERGRLGLPTSVSTPVGQKGGEWDHFHYTSGGTSHSHVFGEHQHPISNVTLNFSGPMNHRHEFQDHAPTPVSHPAPNVILHTGGHPYDEPWSLHDTGDWHDGSGMRYADTPSGQFMWCPPLWAPREGDPSGTLLHNPLVTNEDDLGTNLDIAAKEQSLVNVAAHNHVMSPAAHSHTAGAATGTTAASDTTLGGAANENIPYAVVKKIIKVH